MTAIYCQHCGGEIDRTELCKIRCLDCLYDSKQCTECGSLIVATTMIDRDGPPPLWWCPECDEGREPGGQHLRDVPAEEFDQRVTRWSA